MKTLIIVGSPNKKGKTMELVNSYIANLEGEIKIINVFDYKPLKPCLDCGYCKKKLACSQSDYFTDVIKDINESDCIIIASPMWFGNISGTLMSFMSRLRVLENGYNTRLDLKHKFNKVGVLLLTSGAKWNGMSKSVEATVEFLFKEMDCLMMDAVYANNTDKISIQMNEQALFKCEYGSKQINEWFMLKKNNQYYKVGYSSYNYVDNDIINNN